MAKWGITKQERTRIFSWMILGAGTIMVISPLLDYIKEQTNPLWEAVIGLIVLLVGAYLFNLSD